MDQKYKIALPVIDEFMQFNEEFLTSLNSNVEYLKDAIDSIMHSPGKHIRPFLLLLTAKALGTISKDSVNAAVFVELMHTATLIHDDVIDNTKQRRGVPSLNAIFDNRVSVLVGDFILTTALSKALMTHNFEMISLLSNLGRDLAEGEISQLEYSEGQMLITEEEYFQIIRKKTATLLSVCAELGAISAGATKEDQAKAKEFGEYLGICFQIRDDIFDYYKNEEIGKPSGNDIREGKITLPLIYALKQSGREADPFLKIIEEKDFTEENINALIQFAKDKEGIEYSEEKMNQYLEKALEIIYTLPESAAKNSLTELARFIVQRNK